MAAPQQMQTALLTEHFRYTPLTLLDDIINTVNEIIFRAVNALEQGLGEIPAEALGFQLSREQQQHSSSSSSATNAVQSDEARERLLAELKDDEIERGIVQLESLLNAIVDKDFDKFEIYTLRNILAVGHQEEDLVPWVQLEHYKGLDFESVVDADGQDVPGLPSPEEVQLQRRKLQETRKLNAMLKAEEAKNAAILMQLQNLVEPSQSSTAEGEATSVTPFSILTKHRANGNASGESLTQDVQYALSQLPALQELLGQLKDALGSLSGSRYSQEDEDGAEMIRGRYLDTQASKAAERRGLDPQSTPALTLAGRRLDKEGLDGVKAVINALQDDGQPKEERDV